MSIKVPVLGRAIRIDEVRARDGAGLKLYEDGSKGIFVKDGGNVGIGTTSPKAKLDVVAADYKTISLCSTIADNTDNGGVVLGSRKANSNAPFTGYAVWDDGLYRTLYIGGGGWGLPDANWIEFSTAPSYNETINQGVGRMVISNDGNVGIGTSAPGNPFAVNRSADGIIVDFESADAVEGNVSIAGNTTSYNAFMGSHYTQLKDGQKIPPIGAIVIATGEIIPCEANIEVPVMERYYEEEKEITLKDSIEDNIIEEEVDTGRKETVYVLITGKIVKTQIPILETVTKVKGKKLKDNCRVDKTSGKICEKNDKILRVGEEAPVNVTVLERQKTKDRKPITEIMTKEVSGVERKEYFSYVELAAQKADNRVYGVYHAKLSDDAKGQSFGEDGRAIHQVAALGLYKARVTDTNGDIAAGNYIQSSIRHGEGEKQDDDLLHTYTVGKAIIDVVWNGIKVDSKLGYKWQLIPITLHCG
jgi:hypothetical protein